MPLSDFLVKHLKPKAKPYKVFDERGLFVQVQPTGARYWRFKYRFEDKEKLLALGTYPKVTLAQARAHRDEAQRLLSSGKDPAAVRKAGKNGARAPKAKTFEEVALEFIESRRAKWKPERPRYVLRRLKNNIFESLGSKAIADISGPELLAAIRVIEARGATEEAHTTREQCSLVFDFGIAAGYCTGNPARSIKNALVQHVAKSMAAVSEQQLPKLLRDIEAYREVQTRLALKLLASTFLRTQELTRAEWQEIDRERGVWTIPAVRTKRRRDHLVPLARQSLEVLEELRTMNGGYRWVFPGRDPRKHISNNTLIFALHRMGYRGIQTGHGFRAIASTILHSARRDDGSYRFNSDAIERQLSHLDKNAVKRAYDRSSHWPERVIMMQWYADYLDTLSHSASKYRSVARQQNLLLDNSRV
jgi:integrase